MDKEFNLSEKIWLNVRADCWSFDKKNVLAVKDVKEFIKKLKNKIDKGNWFQSRTSTRARVIKEIDKLAGDKLK